MPRSGLNAVRDGYSSDLARVLGVACWRRPKPRRKTPEAVE